MAKGGRQGLDSHGAANKAVCASAFVVPSAHKVVESPSVRRRQQTLLFAKVFLLFFFSAIFFSSLFAVFCAISLSSFAELRKTFHFDSTLLYF